MRMLIGALVLVLLGAALVLSQNFWRPKSDEMHVASEGEPIVTVSVPPTISEASELGKRVFDAKCSACHGDNAAGRDGVGPPLVHKIYEPSHHGDESFQRAAALGVRSHHWGFGDMAPVEGVTRAEIATVISYIRELQRHNGID